MRDDGGQNAAGRVLDLDGGRNFRDLGGYRGAGGRRVRCGLLYRSGSLAYLSAAGQSALGALGIRTVCDLRTTRERHGEPSVALPGDVRTLSWDYEVDHGAVLGAVLQPAPTAAGVRAAIMEFYRSAPDDFAGRFAEIFRALRTHEVPMVVHCTAGKDRTGILAALVLTALGVAREDVLADYARSDQVTDFESVVREGETWRFLSQLAREVRAPLLASEPAFIEAMLESIRERHRSVAHYLEARLGVDPGALAQLRQRFLTDPHPGATDLQP